MNTVHLNSDLFEHTSLVVFNLSSHDRIKLTYISDNVKKTGYKAEELVDNTENLKKLIPESERERIGTALKTLQPGEQWQEKIRILPKTEELLFYKVHIKKSEQNDNTFRGLAFDVTENEYLAKIQTMHYETNKAFNEAENLEQYMDSFLNICMQLEGIDIGGVYRIKDNYDAELVAHQGVSAEELPGLAYYTADTPQAQIAQQGRPVYNTFDNYLDSIDHNTRLQTPLKSIAVLPIRYNNRTMMLLNLGSKKYSQIPEFIRSTLETLAQQIGSLAHRLELEMQKENNRRYIHSLFRLIPDFIVAFDKEYQVIDYNTAVRQRLGYTDEELLNMQIVDFYDPEHRKKVIFCFDSMFRNECESCTLPMKTKDDKKIHVETKIVKTTLEESDTIIAISHDISEMLQTNAKLQRHIEFENLIIRHAVNFINIHENELDNQINEILKDIGEFIRVDRSYVFQMKKGNRFMDNTHEWCAPGIEPMIDKLQDFPAKEVPWWMEKLTKFENIHIPCVDDLPENAHNTKHILQNQNIRSLIAVPIMVRNKLRGFLGFDAGTCRQKWDEETIRVLRFTGAILANALENQKKTLALVDSENRFRTIANTMHEPMVTIDFNEKILFCNAPVYELYGFDQDISGKQFTDVFQIAEPKRFKSIFNNVQNQSKNEKESYEFTTRKQSGRVMHVELSFSKFKLNKKWRAVLTMHDVTEQKRAHQALVASLRHAKELNELKSRFVSHVSHEFRTPLSSILSSVELLQNYKNRLSDSQKEKHYEHIYQSIHRINHILDDILTYGRIEEKRLIVKPKTVNWTEMLSSLVDELERSFELTNRLHWHVDENCPDIYTDEKHLRQIIANVVANAIKYSSEEQPVNIYIKNHNDVFYVSVVDKGIGIPTDERKLIFEPFLRGSNVGSQKGTGIGLAVVKTLVDFLNGSIELDSENQGGTRFTIILQDMKDNTVIQNMA